MATINLNFNTSAGQDAKLAKILASVNAGRAAQNPPADPFATITDYLRFVVVEAVKSYVVQQSAVDKATVADAFESANPSTQNAVLAALGLV